MSELDKSYNRYKFYIKRRNYGKGSAYPTDMFGEPIVESDIIADRVEKAYSILKDNYGLSYQDVMLLYIEPLRLFNL